MAKRVRMKAWGGFSSGVLDCYSGQDFGYMSVPTLLAVFKTKWEAKERFDDVRRVRVTEIVPKAKAKKKAAKK